MKRKIIRINEDLCNGCGSCVTGCAEGALKIVNGKAKMVNEVFCDGLGACIGHCPTGALVIEERDAPDFDEKAVEEHLAKAPKAAPVHQHHHGPGGCPGMAQRQLRTDTPTATASSSTGLPDQVNPSELRQWPVQLHLVNPANPAFQNKEMVLLSTCSPIASADVHWRYLRGRSVCVACPKLDD
ncbi:MAG: 4Fe-4S binding protein, partial [Pseudomonadota bacterium]